MLLDIWMKAAEEIGIPQTKDFNTGSNYGSGYFDVTQRNGWRLNAYQAFVDPVLSRRSNLDVAVADLVPPQAIRREVPELKAKKPERNERCHCGSGSKYKKCCLPLDEAQGRGGAPLAMRSPGLFR